MNSKNLVIVRNVAALIALALLLPLSGWAKDIALLPVLNVSAQIVKSTRDGFWEKTLVVSFAEPRRVLSTSEGFVHARAIVNHAAQPELWGCVCQNLKTKHEVGGKVYLRGIGEKVAGMLKAKREDIPILATAADMDHLAVVTLQHQPFVVTALVTAGAKSNALRTGVDTGESIEGNEPHGTVIIFILTNATLTDGAMARALITVTEAKTAAFEDLRVPSSYTKNVQATGTGTDGILIASGTSGPSVTYTGGHSKIGELIGKAVYEAVIEALGRQNGFKKPKSGQANF